MVLHVLFDADGRPAAIFPEPREGTEVVEDKTIDFLIENRRRPNGTWVKRSAPTAAEREAERMAQREQARLARIEARKAERKAARLDRLFDKLVEAVAKIDPELAKAAADPDAEFTEE